MRKILKSIIILLIIMIISTYTNIIFAVTQSEIDDMQSEQDDINDSITDAKDKLENVQKEKDTTLAQVNSLSDQIEDYEGQIDKLDDQISSLQEKIQDAEDQIAEDEEKHKQRQELLNDRLVAIYENGETTYLDVLLSSNNIIDFISSYYLMSEITRYDNELLDQIEEDRQKLQIEKTELETDKASLDTSRKTKEAKESALKVVKKEKEAKVGELSETEKELQAQIDELREHESSIKKKIQQMKEEFDRQNSSSSGAAGGTSSFGFGWPVSNNTIGTPYGKKGNLWSLGYHTGVDFPVKDGTPVYAVGNGQVFDTGYSKAYGNYVEIYHGNNVYSFYAHATSVNSSIKVGTKVTKGQQIMLSGHTGNVTGAHLHFEIRTPSYGFYSCVNPMPYLP